MNKVGRTGQAEQDVVEENHQFLAIGHVFASLLDTNFYFFAKIARIAMIYSRKAILIKCNSRKKKLRNEIHCQLGCAAHIRFEANISEYEANIYSLRSE